MDKKEYPFNLLECIFNEGIAIEIMQARPKEIIELDIQYALQMLKNPINKIDERKISIFNDYYEENMSAREIGEKYNIEFRTVLSLIHDLESHLRRTGLNAIIREGAEKYYQIQGAMFSNNGKVEYINQLENIMNTSEGLKYLGLSIRAYNCLRRYDMSWSINGKCECHMSPARLIVMDDKDIKRIRNCGEKTAQEIIGVRDKLRNREGFIKNENGNIQWMIEK